MTTPVAAPPVVTPVVLTIPQTCTSPMTAPEVHAQVIQAKSTYQSQLQEDDKTLQQDKGKETESRPDEEDAGESGDAAVAQAAISFSKDSEPSCQVDTPLSKHSEPSCMQEDMDTAVCEQEAEEESVSEEVIVADEMKEPDLLVQEEIVAVAISDPSNEPSVEPYFEAPKLPRRVSLQEYKERMKGKKRPSLEESQEKEESVKSVKLDQPLKHMEKHSTLLSQVLTHTSQTAVSMTQRSPNTTVVNKLPSSAGLATTDHRQYPSPLSVPKKPLSSPLDDKPSDPRRSSLLSSLPSTERYQKC